MSKFMLPKFDYSFKFTLLGRYGVGKTSLIDRYVEDTFNEETPYRNGRDYKLKIIEIENKLIKLQLWEPEPCCRRYEHIPFSFEIRGAHCLIFIFDLTENETFTFIQNIINKYKHIDEKMINQVCKILVGNKCDKSNKCVNQKDVRDLCNKNNMAFFETSAKSDINVQEIFEFITKQVLDNVNKNSVYTKGLLLNNNRQKEKHYC